MQQQLETGGDLSLPNTLLCDSQQSITLPRPPSRPHRWLLLAQRMCSGAGIRPRGGNNAELQVQYWPAQHACRTRMSH